MTKQEQTDNVVLLISLVQLVEEQSSYLRGEFKGEYKHAFNAMLNQLNNFQKTFTKNFTKENFVDLEEIVVALNDGISGLRQDLKIT